MTVNVYCKITRVSDTEVNKQTSTVCYYGIRLYGKAVEYQGFIYCEYCANRDGIVT